jgi:hypothetical protein
MCTGMRSPTLRTPWPPNVDARKARCAIVARRRTLKTPAMSAHYWAASLERTPRSTCAGLSSPKAHACSRPGSVLSEEQRSMIIVRLAGLAEKLAKLTGEGAVLDEKRILRSRAGKRLVDVLMAALEPWPKAMLAVADAFERFG